MEFLKLALVVAAVAISTCPRTSHSMTLFYIANNSSITIGVGLVKDGEYGIVCDEGDTDTLNFLCNNLGSFGNDSYTDQSMLNVSFVNYNCPSGLSSCGEAASIVSNCSSPLILDCSFSDCFPGQVQLANSVTASTESGVAFVGYPEVCVNGTFAPICNGTELGAIELVVICAYQSTNSSSGLIGNPHNVGLSPLMSSASSSVISYDCDTMANCAVATGMSCTSGYLIVTCEEGATANGTACESSILFNSNTTESADGSVVTTGIYQSCIDGSYVRYCTYQPQWGYPSLVDIVNGLCISLGYSFGVIVPLEGRFSEGSPPGILAIDIDCSSGECNTTQLCDDADRQMVLRCTKTPDCALTGGYLYNNVTTVRDGRQYTSGVFVNCESGFYMAICGTNGNNLSDLCSSGILGFEGGKVVSYNSTVHGVLPLNTGYFTNLDCPSNATSLNNCSANPLNSTECNNTLVLECYRDIITSSITVTGTVTSTVISTTSSPSPTDTSGSGANVGAIVGGSVAGVVAVIVVIVIIVIITIAMYMKKHKSPVVPISEKKSHPI